jgi:hypothetical protein
MPNQKYDPSEFLVTPADHAGESHRVQFQINPDDLYTLDAIVASQVFPYRSRSDAQRHAITLLIKHLSRSEDIDGLVAPYRIRMEPSSQFERADYFQLRFEMLKQMVDHHLSMGRKGPARRLLEEAKARLDKEPQCFWRDRFIRQIDRRWGVFLSEPLARSRRRVQ